VAHDNLDHLRQVLARYICQKGGWTLRALRGLVGDEAFCRGIRAYCRRCQDGNASSGDLVREMEEASGQPLGWHFRQWLYRGGPPAVRGAWHGDASAKQVQVGLEQVQPGGNPFRLPIEVGLVFGGESGSHTGRIEFNRRRQCFSLPVARAPATIVLDRNTWALMRAEFAAR
jgi:aminopeptidase N